MATHPLLDAIQEHDAQVEAEQPAPPTPVEQYEETLIGVSRPQTPSFRAG